MIYRVVMSRSPRRKIAETLPEAVAVACLEFVLGPLAANPQWVGAPLRAPFQGCWRARRGDYRLLCEIDDVSETVTVLNVEHRRDAYRI